MNKGGSCLATLLILFVYYFMLPKAIVFVAGFFGFNVPFIIAFLIVFIIDVLF